MGSLVKERAFTKRKLKVDPGSCKVCSRSGVKRVFGVEHSGVVIVGFLILIDFVGLTSCVVSNKLVDAHLVGFL